MTESSHSSPHGQSSGERDSMLDVIALYEKDVDLSLIRSRLALTPERRLIELMRAQRLTDEMRRAGAAARWPGA